MMTAGLQGDIERGAIGGISCFVQGIDLGVRVTESLVPAFSYDLRIHNDYSTN